MHSENQLHTILRSEVLPVLKHCHDDASGSWEIYPSILNPGSDHLLEAGYSVTSYSNRLRV
jgi:hypothetical protein